MRRARGKDQHHTCDRALAGYAVAVILELAIGAAVGGATYALRRRTPADTVPAATTAVVAGAGSAAVTGLLWSLLGPITLVALPAAAYWAWTRRRPKALPPGR
jgi:hypothetical protein